MAFCEKCGTKIDDGAKFCEKCGAPTGDTASTPTVQAAAGTPNAAPPSAPTAAIKGGGKKLIIGAAAAVVVLVIVFAVVIPNEEANIVNNWVHINGNGSLDLFKDGTGIGDGTTPISWKAENKRLIILLESEQKTITFDYNVSGYKLTLVNDDGDSAIFLKKEKAEEFKAKEKAEEAKRMEKIKSYKYTGRTVKIGNQTWMAENLNSEVAGGKCYENDPSNCAKYGRLYTWNEAMVACPSGYHLPSDAEWTQLTDFIGGEDKAGKKLKSKTGWNNNGNGTDEYGFSALPGGAGNSSGYTGIVGDVGFWWSDTGDYDESWLFRGMRYEREDVSRNKHVLGLYSVRCVQDVGGSNPTTNDAQQQNNMGSAQNDASSFTDSQDGKKELDPRLITKEGEAWVDTKSRKEGCLDKLYFYSTGIYKSNMVCAGYSDGSSWETLENNTVIRIGEEIRSDYEIRGDSLFLDSDRNGISGTFIKKKIPK